MIHLSTLVALLRTLRIGDGGIDGPAAAVGRVPPVTPVATDGEAAIPTAALRQAPFARVAQRPAPTASAASASPAPVATAASSATASTALTFTSVGTLLQSALRESGSAPQPPLVAASSALVDRRPASPTVLARALARSIGESGLFYESHVVRWARNDYPRSALDREPQAGWTAAVGAAAPTGASPAGPAATMLADGAAAQVARQLDALETRQLVWTGPLWPGQRATIELEERTPPPDDCGSGVAPRSDAVWRTRVHVDLPSLGSVTACVTLSGERFDITLDAAVDDAVARLAAARADLGEAFGACRLELRDFAVGLAAER
jgi:hypothetical protein